MSGMFNVNLNGQKISIKVGEKLEEIKKKLGNPDNTIFANVDVNNDGKLDATELEKLKTSLEDNDYEIDVAADGKTPKVAYNQAIQNLKGSYDTEKLKSRYKEDDKYTIKRGDTLYEIAKNQLEAEGLPTDDFRAINNRIAQIANLNDLSDVNNIPVGTELIVKLTDEAIEEVKARDNDSAAAFEGDDEADGDDWTSYGPIKSRGNTEVDNDKNEGSFTAGFESTITVSENGLNMGKGKPVDKDGNELKYFKDPKYQAGGAIMKYQQGDKVMFQSLYNNNSGLLSGVKLYAPSIAELNELKSKCVAARDKIKTAPEGETEEAKATRMAGNLAALKELITLTNGNVQVIKNVADKLREEGIVDKDSDGCKELVQELLLTRNADVVSAIMPITEDDDGNKTADISLLENDRTSNEYLAGLFKEIRDKEKAGEMLTPEEIKLKEALQERCHTKGFKIEADAENDINEKYMNYGDDGGIYYAAYVDNKVYWASDEELLDEFVNKLKAADTDDKKAALFKEYAKTKDVELARCLLGSAKELHAKDEDIKTVINANGMYVLDQLSTDDDVEWSDDIVNTMNARIKSIYTKGKGKLDDAYYLYAARIWIDKLPEDKRDAARIELAETFFKKTKTKDDKGQDVVEYKFEPSRRPTYEEMSRLCYLLNAISDEDIASKMEQALIDTIKLEDMGHGQFTQAIEEYVNIGSGYARIVDGMKTKEEVLDFIENKMTEAKNYNIPFDKILEKFPNDADIKKKLLQYVDDKSTISEANVKVLVGSLGKADIDELTNLASKNPKAVADKLAALVKANAGDKAFIQKVCAIENRDAIPYQILWELAPQKGWDDATKQAVFEKVFDGRISSKDRKKFLDLAVQKGLITPASKDAYSSTPADKYKIGNAVYDTSGNYKEGNTIALRKYSGDGYDKGVNLYIQLRSAGWGDTPKMLKSEGEYKNFVTPDNVASMVIAFNDKSPEEGVMQYIANESRTMSQNVCNVIPRNLMTKAKALSLDNTNEFKQLAAFVNKHKSTTAGYSEDEGKQLDALITALANMVVNKENNW